MQTPQFRLTFSTPAFLGNAEQDGQWRTPPFKALLRQWWRVAYAADHGFAVNIAAMRREEGLLFGNAWLSHREGNRDVADYRKSLVRLRLDDWSPGKLKQWPAGDSKVTHPEVTNHGGQAVPVGSQLYLGYGPLVFRVGATALKANAAIQAAEVANLSLAYPTSHGNPELRALCEDNAPRIERALWLMDRYGTIGGRSRNGWGSFFLELTDGTTVLPGAPALRDWRQALSLDWPHALGRDERGPLIWSTGAFGDWKSLMRELAVIKIGLRTQFPFRTGNNAPRPEERHWLSHPVTKHNVKDWYPGRLPNSLRFKVRPAPNEPRKVVGVIFHVPCLPPPEFHPDQGAIVQTWHAVHDLLDELSEGPGRRGYASIRDPGRRAQLKPALDTVSLTRIPE